MKYYKLLKEIPMFKKGDLFFIHPEQGCLIQKDTLRLAYHKETIDKNPEILNDWFEVVEESENKRWRAKDGDEYWFITWTGHIDCAKDYRDNCDDYRFNTGNYSKNPKEIEARKEYLLARQVLLDDADGGKWIKDGENWHAFYDTNTETYARVSSESYYFPGVIYFKDVENLYESLNEHKKQWEIVHKYEAGEM